MHHVGGLTLKVSAAAISARVVAGNRSSLVASEAIVIAMSEAAGRMGFELATLSMRQRSSGSGLQQQRSGGSGLQQQRSGSSGLQQQRSGGCGLHGAGMEQPSLPEAQLSS